MQEQAVILLKPGVTVEKFEELTFVEFGSSFDVIGRDYIKEFIRRNNLREVNRKEIGDYLIIIETNVR